MNTTDAFFQGLERGISSEPTILDKIAQFEDQATTSAADLFVLSIYDSLEKVAMEEGSSDKKKDLPPFMKKKVEERKDSKQTKAKDDEDKEEGDSMDKEAEVADRIASMRSRFSAGSDLAAVASRIAG